MTYPPPRFDPRSPQNQPIQPWQPQAPWQAGAPVPPGAGVPPPWSRPASVRYWPGAGFLAALAGIVLLVLSLLVLQWAGPSDSTFVKLGENLRAAGSDHVSNQIVFHYAAWAGFVLAGLTALFAIAATIPIPATSAGNTYARVIGAVVAGVGAVLHAVVVTKLFPAGSAPHAGAWLGLAGYLAASLGMVLGARRVAAAAY